jgi:predicted Zn-dependent peptidase
MAVQPRKISHIERVVLGNELRVVVAPDPGTSMVAVAVVYDVGFRSEPEGRTGFAHLFEHLMFQGSANVGKVEHIQHVESAGGVMNGHTMPDLTAYYEALPAGALELALWLEADRMGSLALNGENLRNQVDVVEEEINVNILNQPYGGFPWISLPACAFDLFPNSHNGYGDFAHLEIATVDEAQDFYARYYSPANAVLAVVGDCSPQEVFSLVQRHFGHIPGNPAPPHGPWPEPPLASERHRKVPDPLIPQPAFAVGYRTPDPVALFDEYLVYAVLGSILADGDASRLRHRLMHRDRTVTDIGCMLGSFGNDGFLMRDPVLFQVVVYHPGTSTTEQLLRSIDEELSRLASDGPTPDEMQRVGAMNAGAYWRELDSVLTRSIMFASTESVHGRAELVSELPERLAAVEGRAVAVAASALLAQRRAVVELEPSPAS